MGEAEAVLAFWQDAGPEYWFKKDDRFDQSIVDQFAQLVQKAEAGELAFWQNEADSALALILIFDQFSRNLYRDDARAFAFDAQALEITRLSLARGFDNLVDPAIRQFFYMPLMHSESIVDQQACVQRFHASGNAGNLKFAIIHRDIIARFGRFPHRNNVLGCSTSMAERAFLDEGGFSG